MDIYVCPDTLGPAISSTIERLSSFRRSNNVLLLWEIMTVFSRETVLLLGGGGGGGGGGVLYSEVLSGHPGLHIQHRVHLVYKEICGTCI